MRTNLNLLVAIVGSTIFSFSAIAQNSCASAGIVFSGSQYTATPNTGGGAVGSGSHASWYRFTASSNGTLSVSSCNGSTDTKLFIYRGTCSSLNQLYDRDDDCGTNEIVNFTVTGGTSYYIEWTNSFSSSSFNWTLIFTPPGGNGTSCQSALTANVGTYTARPYTGGGSQGSGTNASWYKYTPSSSGTATVSSCGGSTDTRLHIYGGSCSNLSNIANNDDDCSANETETFSVTAGNTYLVEWTDAYSNTSFQWSLSFSPSGGSGNGNTCATAYIASNGSYSAQPGNGGGASGFGTNATWYRYTPSVNGSLRINSCGGSTDSKLFIYSGTCASLNQIYDRDDDCGSNEDVTFTVTSGTTYFIEWTDEFSQTAFNWNLTFTPGGGGGSNGGNSCNTAIAVSAGTYSAEPNSASGAQGSGSNAVWYRFSPSAAGIAVVSSCGGKTDTRLHIYSGNCTNLVSVSDNDDDCAANEQHVFSVNPSLDYYIEWTDEYSDALFNWSLTFTPGTGGLPGNDCASAYIVSTGIHSARPNSGNGAQGSGSNSVWFTYSPDFLGTATVSSCGELADTRLHIYAVSCQSSNELFDRDNDCGFNEEVSFQVSPGTMYYIEWTDANSSDAFNWSLQFLGGGTTNGNDCFSASNITSGIYEATITTGNGASGSGTHAAWYAFQPLSSGVGVISSCGQSSNTCLFLYEGDCNNLSLLDNTNDNCDDNEQVTFQATGGNTYFIEWTDEFSSSTFEWNFNYNAVGTEELLKSKLVPIYPNPFNTHLSFELEGHQSLEIKIFDARSVLVHQTQLESEGGSEQQVDLSFLNKGLYIVLIRDEAGLEQTKKLLKN